MMTEFSLPPLGHIGRFLNELFPEVDGINEYEGSVHIRSTNQQEFAGITLRVTGNQLTSLPLVAPPPEGADWDQLAFPRVGDGLLEGLRIATSTILFNTTTETVVGAVEFFNSDGTPMEVNVGQASAARTFGDTPTSRLDFSIEPKGVRRLRTAGSGEIKVGWALVSMDQPISGTALFTLFDESGEVATEVGVNSARLRRNFNLLADTADVFNTGIAITNPVKSEDEGDEPTATVRIELRNGSRRILGRTEVEIGPLQHTALFLTELFPEIEGIDELQGLVWVSSSEFVTALSLRSASEKLTSVPVFTPKNGFAPNSTLEFAQNLAGTAPPVRLLLHQNSRDLALRRVVISAPQERVACQDHGSHNALSLGSDGSGGIRPDLFRDSGVIRGLEAPLLPAVWVPGQLGSDLAQQWLCTLRGAIRPARCLDRLSSGPNLPLFPFSRLCCPRACHRIVPRTHRLFPGRLQWRPT